MANTNSLFLSFDEKIKLTTAKSDNLRRSRDALREDIKQWFDDNGKLKPSFCWQGSFAMKTTVNPINGDYDIDDGVYLSGYETADNDEWPATATVHRWVKNATDEQTCEESVDKNTCVRVKYASGYHVDLPIYIVKDDTAYLAHKSSGWIESDPKAFKDWFVDKVQEEGEQLRRVVRYLKGWKDNKELPIKGVELTILASEYFDSYSGRDDKSLKNTVTCILDKLNDSYSCIKPVLPGEDLFEGHSDTKMNQIIDGFSKLKDALEKAITEDDEKKASEILRDEFGSRFPIGKAKESSKYESTTNPGVLRHDGRSG